MPNGSLGPLAKPKRIDAISDATTWHGGTQANRLYVQTFSEGNFTIALGKPGKEADISFRRPNFNDMAPTVFYNSEKLDFRPTFEDIWQDFENLGTDYRDDGHPSTLEIIGALLFRAAFMLDHVHKSVITQSDSSANLSSWVWLPPKDTMNILTARHTHIGKPISTADGGEVLIPVEVYLQLVDAIAYNEDVKYQAKNVTNAAITNTGRINTLGTCVHMLAGYIGHISITNLVSKMMRGKGVAAISQQDAKKYFPLLT